MKLTIAATRIGHLGFCLQVLAKHIDNAGLRQESFGHKPQLPMWFLRAARVIRVRHPEILP
jgi:hypothetical protein